MFSLLILIPLFLIIVLNLYNKAIMRKTAFALTFVFCLCQIVMSVAPFFGYNIRSFDAYADFFSLSIKVDNISLVVLLCIGIVSLATLLVARQSFEEERTKYNFTNLLLISIAGMNGVAMVDDIFSLYVFVEVGAVAAYILVAIHKDRNGLRASFKYLMLSSISTVMMLSAISIMLLISGDLSFEGLRKSLQESLPDPQKSALIMLSMGIFICAISVKAGIMPFHGWLPDAYTSSPAPVSILLAGIGTKALGVYSLMRIFISVFAMNESVKVVLLIIASVSIVFGALAALVQHDMKKLLSFSSISQVGYIILGLGCGTPLAIFGAVFHFFNHSIFKSLLFVNAAAVESRTGDRNMERLSGLSERMPFTGISSVIGSMSAAGIPPLSGFWSKVIIILALWKSHLHFYALLAIFSSVITLGYMLTMQRKVFFGKIKEEYKNIKEAEFGYVFPALILAVIIIGVGILFPFIPEEIINSFIG